MHGAEAAELGLVQGLPALQAEPEGGQRFLSSKRIDLLAFWFPLLVYFLRSQKVNLLCSGPLGK